MTFRLIKLLTLLLLACATLFAQEQDKKLSKLTLKNMGVPAAYVTEGINRSEIIKSFRKQDWQYASSYISGAEINIKKIIYTNHTGFEMRFTYSSKNPRFESDIYLDATKPANLELDNMGLLFDYMTEIREMLERTDLLKLDDFYDYRAPGDKVCGFDGEYKAKILVENIDISRIKKINEIEYIGYGALIQQIKDYLMLKTLNTNTDVKANISKILSNDNTDDEKKIEEIKKSLKDNNMYEGQIKNLLGDLPLDNKIILDRIKDVIGVDFSKYDQYDVPEDIFLTIGYYDLKVGLSCFIKKLSKQDIHTVKISMDNSLGTKLIIQPEKDLSLDMKDYFTFDN